MKLDDLLKKEISEHKTIPINKLIYFINYSKSFGYYNSEKSIGDDFITFPMKSNLFCYLIGLFLFKKWKEFFYNKEIYLVELGGGMGKLMKNILIFLKNTEMYEKIISINMVEHNDFLKRKQIEILSEFEIEKNFFKDYSFINFKTKNPIFFFSNEFFDCLPISQIFHQNNEFFQTNIFLNNNGEFKIGYEKAQYSDQFYIKDFNENNLNEKIFEISPMTNNIIKDIVYLLNQNSGLNLIIDYGYIKNTYKSTMQCIYKHQNISINDCIKFSGDISFHVNFSNIQNIIKKNSISLKEEYLDSQNKFIEENLLENKDPFLDYEKEINKIIDKNDIFKVFYNINL